jgi:uncharacterized protein YndB with AHSA1/START domain
MHSIKHLFHINAPIETVYNAIASIDGLKNWWTAGTSGSDALNGILQFRFGDTGPDMKITKLEPNRKIAWECVESPHGWTGNTLTFLLDRNEDKTRVRFSHDGWETQDDFYAICSFTWGRFMESLRQLCQTGKGEAFGSDNSKK